jgi:biotin operon repressor
LVGWDFVTIFAVEIETIKNYRDMKDKVLAVMKEAGEPLNAGKIAELSGLDRKEVDKAMKQLKDAGAIVSPVRCKWEPAK